MFEYIITIIVALLGLLGISLEIAASFINNKEDPRKINYYRCAIYIILLFWAMLYE